MTSSSKIEANRRNAALSTGPRSAEGKAVSSLNAMKHGLLSREALLPGEPETELVELGKGLRTRLRPVGELENLLVDRMVAAAWRLRRLHRVETGLLLFRRHADEAQEADEEARSCELNFTADFPSRDVLPRDQERHASALERSETARALARGEVAALGRVFVGAEATFGNLSRYEAGLERALYRALHELQRLQSLRAGEPVSPPAVLDGDLNVSVRAPPPQEPVSQPEQLQDPVASGEEAGQG